MASNRLSELADNLLQHILSFAPAREAAASAILSRRWRPLWRRTSAVHLDIRSYSTAKDSPLDAFFRDAVAALAAFPRRSVLRRCTVLELEACFENKEIVSFGHIGIQHDMPNLRSFRYNGHSIKLSLISPAPGLARVDLDATYQGGLSLSRYEPMPGMLTSFSTARALKLNVSTMKDILDGEKEQGRVILPTFPDLKFLHIDALHEGREQHHGVVNGEAPPVVPRDDGAPAHDVVELQL
jgi:hypothetical protein